MFDWSWITSTSSALLMVVVTTMATFLALLMITRLVGLRSFSKMSSFDFAITVATGSLLASTLVAENPPLVQGVVGLASLYGIQFLVSFFRTRSPSFSHAVDNEPLLLMAGERVLEENLRHSRVTHADLRAKLREANVIHPRQVRAVVLETTGDVSVLHADPDGPDLDLSLLKGVRGVEQMQG